MSQLTREVGKDEEVQFLKDLETYGYAQIKSLLKPEVTQKLLSLVESHYKEINKNGVIKYPGTPARDSGDKILYNLQNKDKVFIDILTTDFIRKVGMAKLNDTHYRFLPPEVPNYNLLYYNARSSGDNKLDLHIDSHIPFIGSYTSMMQFAFVLEEQTESNGPTTVVPGSHKSGTYTDRELKNIKALSAKPGDLVCWDSRLWHGTLPNVSRASRWSLIATVGMWWVKPSMNMTKMLPESMYKKLSDEQKALLGFCAIPPDNEFERNNTKCGYEFLKPSVKDY